MDSLPRQMLLAGEPDYAAVDDECGGVVEAAFEPHRKPDRHDHPPGVRFDLLKHLPREFLHAGRKKGVFAAIARDAEFWQADDRQAALPRHVERRNDPIAVTVPIERRLVEGDSADMNQVHDEPARRLVSCRCTRLVRVAGAAEKHTQPARSHPACR